MRAGGPTRGSPSGWQMNNGSSVFVFMSRYWTLSQNSGLYSGRLGFMRPVNSPSYDWFVYSLHFTWLGAQRRDGNVSTMLPFSSTSYWRATPPPPAAFHPD